MEACYAEECLISRDTKVHYSPLQMFKSNRSAEQVSGVALFYPLLQLAKEGIKYGCVYVSFSIRYKNLLATMTGKNP